MVYIKAPKAGKCTFIRALTQIHGAFAATWREVSIYYKTYAVAQLLHLLKEQLPSLFDTVVDDDTDRMWSLGILHAFVAAHVGTEIPDLRQQGMWKASVSAHSGDKVYRCLDASWDVERFGKHEETRELLRQARAAADVQAPIGKAARLAAVLKIFILRVAPQTILRPVAKALIDETTGTSHELSKADFDFIDEFIWDTRLGHALTHEDAKVSRFIEFFHALQEQHLPQATMLGRLLIWAHSAYMVRSGQRHLISEDVGSSEATVRLDKWLSSQSVLERREIVAQAVRDCEHESLAIQRHGISGCPFTTKPPNEYGRGGQGPSLVGSDDFTSASTSLSNEHLSLIDTMWKHREVLANALATDGVVGLLKQLKKPAIKGAGSLISERTLTYLEGTGALGHVTFPYLTGGMGSRKAKTFAASVLGIDDAELKQVSTLEMLTALKTQLEEKTRSGDTQIASALRAVAQGCTALEPLEDLCTTLGSSCLTGGTLETMLCDVVWRCFRRLVLKCEKPRLRLWDADLSGGNPMEYFPIWENNLPTTAPRLLCVRKYLKEYVKRKIEGVNDNLDVEAYYHKRSTWHGIKRV